MDNIIWIKILIAAAFLFETFIQYKHDVSTTDTIIYEVLSKISLEISFWRDWTL